MRWRRKFRLRRGGRGAQSPPARPPGLEQVATRIRKLFARIHYRLRAEAALTPGLFGVAARAAANPEDPRAWRLGETVADRRFGGVTFWGSPWQPWFFDPS